MMRAQHIGPTPISGLPMEMDRLFGDLFDPGGGGSNRLAVDLWETADAFAVQAPMPGVDVGDVEILLRDDVLTIRGSVSPPTVPEGAVALRQECTVGTFERELPLPTAVDGDHVKARLTDGMLQIEIPKAADAKARRIEIQG